MKKIINIFYIVFLLSIILSTGCTDKLTEDGKYIVGPDSYFQNDAEFQAAVVGVYNAIYSGPYSFNAIWLLTGGGEDTHARQSAPELIQWSIFQPVPSASYNGTMWNACYLAINSANLVIDKAENSTAISDANKTSYLAQVRFLRAVAYLNLVRFWGEVPIATVENTVGENSFDIVQSPVADIYNIIVSDFQYAEANLPATQANKGRATSSAAKAMLARTYLTMAGWPIKDNTKYAAARDKAKEVMDLGIYELEPDFADLWLYANRLTNKEYIFAFYGTESGSVSTLTHMGQRPNEESGWTDVCSEDQFFYAFPDGYRKEKSFWAVFGDAKNTKWEESQEGQPYIAKFREAGPAATMNQGSPNSTGGGSGWFPLIRYADVLLMYAEAANMAEGGPSALAIECINSAEFFCA